MSPNPQLSLRTDRMQITNPKAHTHKHTSVLLIGEWMITQSSRGGKVSLCLPQPLLSVTSHTSYCTRLKTFMEKYNTWNGMLSMCPTLFENTRCGLNTWNAMFNENGLFSLDSSYFEHWQKRKTHTLVYPITSRSQQLSVCKDKRTFKRLDVYKSHYGNHCFNSWVFKHSICKIVLYIYKWTADVFH